LHLDAGVVALSRHADGVELRTADGRALPFDQAVVATHPDEALDLLADPTADERRILGTFAYTENETVLHTDDRFLPRHAAARASWNFHVDDCRAPATKPTVTYYLNRLQRLDEPEHYCVTLNRSGEIREDRVIKRLVYHHPLYTRASLVAQQELPRLNGRARTVYCGAYHGFGFHEDGLVSGLAAARALGVEP
jgi:predicted NAD/FAD-binding protein